MNRDAAKHMGAEHTSSSTKRISLMLSKSSCSRITTAEISPILANKPEDLLGFSTKPKGQTSNGQNFLNFSAIH